MKNKRLPTKHEVEKKVLEYIEENTVDNYYKFNPIALSYANIIDELQIKNSYVANAIENLSKNDNGEARIEEIKGDFAFYIAKNENGQILKETLLKSNLSFYNWGLFTFIFTIGSYFLVDWLMQKEWLNLTSNADFFYAGVISLLISIKLGKSICNKYYFFTQQFKEVKGYKYYFWSFVLITIGLVYMNMQGKNFDSILFTIATSANIVTIVAFIISLIRKVKEYEN